MKLPKSIIKKYGISKKAWAVFRGKKSSASTSTMARRTKRKSRRGGFARFGRRKGRRSSASKGVNPTGLVIGAMVYGAGREWLSDKLQPLTSKIPAGDFADEVGLGVLSYFVAKGSVPLVNKIPYSRDIGKAGLAIEAARVGSYLGAKYIPSANSNVTTNQQTAYGGWS